MSNFGGLLSLVFNPQSSAKYKNLGEKFRFIQHILRPFLQSSKILINVRYSNRNMYFYLFYGDFDHLAFRVLLHC